VVFGDLNGQDDFLSRTWDAKGVMTPMSDADIPFHFGPDDPTTFYKRKGVLSASSTRNIRALWRKTTRVTAHAETLFFWDGVKANHSPFDAGETYLDWFKRAKAPDITARPSETLDDAARRAFGNWYFGNISDHLPVSLEIDWTPNSAMKRPPLGDPASFVDRYFETFAEKLDGTKPVRERMIATRAITKARKTEIRARKTRERALRRDLAAAEKKKGGGDGKKPTKHLGKAASS
jgi:hypothetical protein